MTRVAVIGTNRRGKQAVLAVGTYSGTWTIRDGALSNDTSIECAVIGRGTAESMWFVNGGRVVLGGDLNAAVTLERDTATLAFPAGEVTWWADWTGKATSASASHLAVSKVASAIEAIR